MTKRLSAASLYAVAFLAQYQCLTEPLFGYWGFGPITHAYEYLYLVPLMVFPALFMPDTVDKPSALLAFLNYVILYVPLCVLLFHSTKTSISPGDLWGIFSALAASTVLLFAVPSFAPIPLKKRTGNPGPILVLCWCVLAVVVLAVLALNRVHLIGFKGIGAARLNYEQRIRVLGPLFGYLDSWCGLAFIPFLFAERLGQHKRAACVLLGAVCVTLFLVTGRKTVLLSPLVVLGAYCAVKRGWRPAALMVLFSSLLLLPFFFGALGLKGPRLLYINVVNFRIFAVPQVLVPQYYAYYLQEGFTHFRHINLVNRLFYGNAMFEQPWAAIARFYYKKTFTADAVFYATDGLAAMGILGIPCVTLALVLVFWVFDSLQVRHSKLLVLPAILPFLFSLFNNSLFTTMLTGGGLMLMLLLYLLPDTA
jgi:hypothetical protein